MNPIHTHDHSAAALNAQGCTLCEQNQFAQALETFDQALALDSTYCTVWNNRANALCGLKRQAEALAAYDRAVALAPQYHQAWFNRGKLLAEMGAYGNAVESYNRAIALEADPIYIHAKADIWVKKQLIATV
ncbi:tetratricopeptide repeat protein [Leptolyngbya sp. CCNP1308]|uniref:tetratricopeptide repeat protein n=1 Tax=Leptolyngbya sp. CCNP1308 TaxID=3110255 RepID=UPI002B201F8F|nr:tetratricopeptide repeat protein [Leptolyngbya sp. CCNP1308]MEA5450846.1 tetratricopeptide repeat protein [Leptolyngbya sp. CCNP1308]